MPFLIPLLLPALIGGGAAAAGKGISSLRGGGGGFGKKEAERAAGGNVQLMDKLVQEFLGKQRGFSEQITPFAEMLLQFGRDPTAFLASPQGQSLLAPLQQATAKNFEGARVSLADQMAGSGMSNAAPFGNLLGQEAGAQSQNVLAMISQALGLGSEGANILTGQQQIFDPFKPAAISTNLIQSVLNKPGSGVLNSLIGAGGQALSGFFQRNK